jgi:thioredoxin-related protein
MKLGALTLVFLVTLSSGLVAADSRAASNELKWYSFDEGMAVGKSEGKKIFIHFWAEWCRYCRTMERKTFRNPSVIAYLKKNFISIKVDYDREKKLVSIFKVRGLPDNWFFSKDGEISKHQPGYIPPKKFLKLLKNI